MDGAGSRRNDGDARGVKIRQRPALRRRCQCRQVHGGRGWFQRLPARHGHAGRLWLRQGIPRRTLPARDDDSAHRADQPATHPVLHRREGARAAQILLTFTTSTHPVMTTTHNSERAEQLTMLRESALSFVTKESPLNRARALRQQMPGYDRRFWGALAEQGWTGLLVPEQLGGYAQGFTEMGEVAAALASQVAPEPVVPVLVFAGRLLSHAGANELSTRLLTELAEGRTLPAVAWQEDVTGTKDRPGQAATRLERQGDALLLNGCKRHVRPGAGADGYIVSATGPQGLALVWVQADASGLTLSRQPLAAGRRDRAAPRLR